MSAGLDVQREDWEQNKSVLHFPLVEHHCTLWARCLVRMVGSPEHPERPGIDRLHLNVLTCSLCHPPWTLLEHLLHVMYKSEVAGQFILV